MLTLANVQLAQAGVYSVLVTNSFGSTNSAGAVLAVFPPSACVPPPLGLAGWWRAEGDGSDSAGANNAVLKGNAAFASGKVGQGFSLNGTSAYLEVPSSSSLSPSGPFTIETWINYGRITSSLGGNFIVVKGLDCNCLVDWAMSVSTSLKLRPHVNINGGWHYFDCNTTLASNTWYHVAMVYDGANLIGYVNGVADGQTQVGPGNINVSANPLRIGVYSPGQSYAYFAGLIDELSIYGRALSQAEIQAVYSAGVSGKCFVPSPPVILMQPTNLTVAVGATATLLVMAVGTPPLSYQWSWNGTNLPGGTNTMLTLTNVQLAQAGNYSVLVTNAIGSVTSSSAALTVYGMAPTIVSQPPARLFSPDRRLCSASVQRARHP